MDVSSKLGQQVGKRQATTSTGCDSMVGAMLCSHSWKGNSANNTDLKMLKMLQLQTPHSGCHTEEGLGRKPSSRPWMSPEASSWAPPLFDYWTHRQRLHGEYDLRAQLTAMCGLKKSASLTDLAHLRIFNKPAIFLPPPPALNMKLF